MTELAGSIRRDLYAIADLYDEALEPVRRASGSQVKASKEPPLPISAHVIDVRWDALRDLNYWAGFLLEEIRDVNGEHLTNRLMATDSAALVAFIVIWVDRLISEFPDDADNLAEDAAKHAKALRNLVQETGSRRFPIGKCIEHGTSDLGERTPCAGELRAVLRKDDDLLPSEITCSVDEEHRWAASDWVRLGRRIVTDRSA